MPSKMAPFSIRFMISENVGRLAGSRDMQSYIKEVSCFGVLGGMGKYFKRELVCIFWDLSDFLLLF